MKRLFLLLLSLFFCKITFSQVEVQNISPIIVMKSSGRCHFVNSNLGFAYGYAPSLKKFALVRTINGGNLWDVMSTDTFNKTLPFSFINQDTGFAVGGCEYWRTFDAGKNWVKYKLPDSLMAIPGNTGRLPYYINTKSTTSREIFFVAHFGDKSLYKSGTYDNSWQKVSDTGRDGICFVNDKIAYALGPLCNNISGLNKSVNGGNSWFCLNSTDSLNNFVTLHFPTEDTGYCYHIKKGVIRTTDGGLTWKTVNTGLFKPSGTFDCPISFPSSHVGYVLGPKWTLYKTKDAGQNWVLLKDFAKTFNYGQIYAFSEDTIILVNDQAILDVYKVISPPIPNHENQITFSFKVFPNPANKVINFEWENINKEHFEIIIYNLYGEIISIENSDNHSKTIDVSGWAKGIYTIKLKSDQFVTIKKVIVNN